jgi:hypothetical protein
LRHPFESIYTRGEKYRCIEVKLQETTGNGRTNDDVGVVSIIQLFNWLIICLNLDF